MIGFWSEKKAPGNAARKAFITTRIGDLGMVFAIMLLYSQTHSFAFDEIFRRLAVGGISEQFATWSSLGSIGRRPDMFEYPYVLLWALPLLGSGMASINKFLGFEHLANVAAVFPLSLFAMTLILWTFFREFG